ncbi:hypothetical protein PHYSODRAFT_329505 [Phytophthora sojae]|uniref:Uncharacterized protein n=1 Tax=Phytophthora sojae (strain P6497) TaxID=1094619 RepID=G4Z421_PHYSP|nr:hypothetical protein PHYSODRAFT_329505 [Phytophthora sojae]EGZ21573.1 hypothetical protein PHYSODRAFT_329505 [Phytophthora sojae]|eukprot:XP_009524290.1 hypothetical protein PHYSODRAFT_329505 [Phytophthora sojae]
MAAASLDLDFMRALPDLEKRLQDDLKSTKCCSLSAEEDTDCTPIVVCESVTRQDLNRWVRKSGAGLPFHPQEQEDLPTIVHTIAANEVVDLIREQIVLMAPAARLMRTLRAGGGARYDVGDRLQAPDQCLIPAGAPPGTYRKTATLDGLCRLPSVYRSGLSVVDFDFGRDHEVCFPLCALYFGVDLPDALQKHEGDEVALNLTELRSSINAVIPKQ